MLGYLVFFGCVVFVALTCVLCGVIAGWVADSTVVASLTSVLLFVALLGIGCWLLYQSIPADKNIHAQSVGFLILFGGVSLGVGGSFCALTPIGLRWMLRL